jgi:hypothetical protein
VGISMDDPAATTKKTMRKSAFQLCGGAERREVRQSLRRRAAVFGRRGRQKPCHLERRTGARRVPIAVDMGQGIGILMIGLQITELCYYVI